MSMLKRVPGSIPHAGGNLFNDDAPQNVQVQSNLTFKCWSASEGWVFVENAPSNTSGSVNMDTEETTATGTTRTARNDNVKKEFLIDCSGNVEEPVPLAAISSTGEPLAIIYRLQ